MPAFARLVQEQARKPSIVVTLPPSAWCDTWPDKPTKPVEIGVRTVGEKSFQAARANAARRAWELHPEDGQEPLRIDAYNDALVAIIAAEAACMPDDVSALFFGEMAEDQAELALTTEGLRVIFQALERLIVGTSPIAPEASDEDIATLVERAPEALKQMADGRARRLRRLLAHVLAELPAGA